MCLNHPHFCTAHHLGAAKKLASLANRHVTVTWSKQPLSKTVVQRHKNKTVSPGTRSGLHVHKKRVKRRGGVMKTAVVTTCKRWLSKHPCNLAPRSACKWANYANEHLGRESSAPATEAHALGIECQLDTHLALQCTHPWPIPSLVSPPLPTNRLFFI